MAYVASKPNRITVWCMFALGIMIGVGGAYVSIDPDGLVDMIAQRLVYAIPMCPAHPTESVASITQSAQDIFQTP